MAVKPPRGWHYSAKSLSWAGGPVFLIAPGGVTRPELGSNQPPCAVVLVLADPLRLLRKRMRARCRVWRATVNDFMPNRFTKLMNPVPIVQSGVHPGVVYRNDGE